MTTRRKFVLSTLGLLVGPSCTHGGTNSLHGNEPRAWDDGGYNLIIAEAQDVMAVPGDKSRGNYKAKLIVFATLAGTLDPGANASLEVTFECGVPGPVSILAVPKNGAMVLAVLGEKDYVTSDDCSFMPDRSALVTIDGLADKRVMETIRKLRFNRHPAEADIPMEFPKERGGVKPGPPQVRQDGVPSKERVPATLPIRPL
jgi:hypothetical protein